MVYIIIQDLSAGNDYCIKVYKLNSMWSVGQLIEVYIVQRVPHIGKQNKASIQKEKNSIFLILREKNFNTCIYFCYLYVHTHALTVFYYSAFHAMEKRSLLRSVDNDLHFFTGFISCIQLLY